MIINKSKPMKLAITPRFFGNEVEQLIAVEKKYYPFFKSFGVIANFIGFDLLPNTLKTLTRMQLYSPEAIDFTPMKSINSRRRY